MSHVPAEGHDPHTREATRTYTDALLLSLGLASLAFAVVAKLVPLTLPSLVDISSASVSPMLPPSKGERDVITSRANASNAASSS